jgi:hypothetical protein
MPPEAWEQINRYGIFAQPVQVVLVARAAPPGLQCQLYAMVPLPDDEDDEPEEPWAASVPGASYEASVEEEGQEEGEPRVAPIPLGHIVRYERDGTPSLALEAVDAPEDHRRDTSEVVDRALADLLGLWARSLRAGASRQIRSWSSAGPDQRSPPPPP